MLPAGFSSVSGTALLQLQALALKPHVHRERLHLVLEHMKERIAGKMANRSDNAFRLRRLFKMYDEGNTGLVRCCSSGQGSAHGLHCKLVISL